MHLARLLRLRNLSAATAATLLLAWPARADLPPARLVLSTPKIEPTTTFEIRFNSPMVPNTQVGKPVDPSPVEVHPAVKGRFVWLSSRSGAFAPEEPLPLSTTFRFALREGLTDAAGKTLPGEFDGTFETPLFALKGWHTRTYISENDAPAEPRFSLLFNADVEPERIAGSIRFLARDGRKIAAQVIRAEPKTRADHAFPIYRSNDRSLLTWADRFRQRLPPSQAASTEVPAVRANQVVVTPVTPLPVGEKWKLVLDQGLAASEAPLNLLEAVEIPIGTVRPFTVQKVAADNDGSTGRRVLITFSKSLSKEITPETISRWIQITPSPADLAAQVSRSHITFTGAFELEKQYAVEVKSGLAALQPFTLVESVGETVEFEPIAPSLALEDFATHQLSTGTRRFHLNALNVPRLRVSAKVFQPETLPFALTAYDEYLNAPHGGSGKIDPAKVAGSTVFQRDLDGTEQIDRQRGLVIDWDEILGAGRKGVVLLTAEQIGATTDQHPGVQAIVQVTDLGVVWKAAPSETFVHVFSLASGTSLAGTKVRLVSADHKMTAPVLTDESGVARIGPRGEARWLLAEKAGDMHLVPLEHGENQLSLYHYKIPFRDAADGDEEDAPDSGRQVFLFTERNVYRPGETAHLKGIIRDTRAGQPRIPKGTKVQLKAFDSREREIFKRELTVSDTGSLDADIALPNGSLGEYTARVFFGESEDAPQAQHVFQVQEYTPNAFEIQIEAPKHATGSGPLELPVRAKYFMGKALSKAEVTWSLQGDDAGFAPEGFDDFAFCDAIGDYRLQRALDRRSHFADQGKLELGEDGSTKVETTFPLNSKAPQPRTARLLCEITDLNQQTVSEQSSATVHSSDFYLGLRTLPEVVRSGDALPIDLIAVRTDGTPLPEPVPTTLRLTRIDWQNNRIETDEDTSESQSTPLPKLIAEQTLPTQSLIQREHKWTVTEPRESGWTAGEPGLYLIEATAKDTAGREVLTAMTFYVSGEGATEWNARNQFQIELVPDKTEYLSGETARVLVKTPISGEALVTVERDRVLRSFVTKLSGNAPTVDVPLESADAPNVFVSVMLLRGAEDSPRKFKAPEYRVGFCQLTVTRPESQLSVYLTPERQSYQPGETVTVTCEVKDFAGKAKSGAELTVYAVDEGVLSLTGYTTPDPFAFFNEPLPLSVSTSLTLPTLLSEDPDERSFSNKGYLVGGGGEADAFRKNFVTCAFWNATLRSDETGRVSASFTAPDSLTRYRLIAVVQTQEDAFGSAESAFEVNKPIMLEPALPRFANVGDALILRAVLHSRSDVAGEVVVALELDATATAETKSLRVQLPARGSVAVDFPVTFAEVGEAKWKWTAAFASADGATRFRDAVITKLKVGYPVATLRELHVSRADGDTDLLADVNPALLEGTGMIRVSLGHSRAIELREGLEQLLHYPYGCVEQTTSSTLPWIVLRDLRGHLPTLSKTDAELAQAINRGVDRLLSMQTTSGGLAYWPGQREPLFWGSAYGGMGLALAKRGGFPVPAEAFDNLLVYLSQGLRGLGETSERWGLSERCLALYTLAIAGKPEASYHEVLFRKRAALDDESRALLALAIAESNGPAKMIEELLSERWRGVAGNEHAFWSASRETAIRLLAWARLRPEGTEADRLSTELFGQRETGHWRTTQGNCWALLALSDYLKRVELPNRVATGVLAHADDLERFELSNTRAVQRREFSIKGSAQRLRLLNPSRRIYTEVAIEAKPRTLTQPRQDQGYGIERTYSRVEDDGSLTELSEPRVGDRVLITLRLDVRRHATYVAVDDPLPSIFEAVNPVFKSQATSAGEVLSQEWTSDYQELREDRALFFADQLSPGSYTIRYLARVRAAGTSTAPAAKIEEMYHPERFGMTETMRLTSLALTAQVADPAAGQRTAGIKPQGSATQP
ncbi:MAG: Large extracellular alpha-helical protein [Chthoniobacter sp.]|nr:Large extracellular alpha-helical protein [Chthoniobacter sp.]